MAQDLLSPSTVYRLVSFCTDLGKGGLTVKQFVVTNVQGGFIAFLCHCGTSQTYLSTRRSVLLVLIAITAEH